MSRNTFCSHFQRVFWSLLLLAISVMWPEISIVRAQNLQEVNARVKQVQALEAAGKYSEATQEYQKILTSVEASFGPDSEPASDVLHMVALSLRNEGMYAAAEPYFLKSIRIKERVYGPNDVLITGRLANLASLYKEMGRYDESEPLQLRALKIREQKLPPDDIDIAASLNNLGNLYNELGRYSECEPLYKRTLKIVEAKLGPNHAMVATVLNNIGRQYKEQEKFAEAEPYYLRSLKIREQQLGPDDPDVGFSLLNLALLYAAQERYDEMEPLLLRNLKIQETKLGPNHPNVANALRCLANMYHADGRIPEAIKTYERAIKIFEDKFGKSHPLYTESNCNLGVIYGQNGIWLEAAQWMYYSRRGVRQHVASVLPALLEKQQQDFLETDKRNLHCCLSVALKASQDPIIAATTAEFLLNAKGVGHTVLVERAQIMRNVGDPRLKPQVDELLAMRRRLVTLRQTAVKPDQEALKTATIQELETKEQELSLRLPQLATLKSAQNEWIDLDVVRKIISPEVVFIDIARIEPFKFSQERLAIKKRFSPARYVAWIVPPSKKGDVQIVDLGPADVIEAAVAKAREAIASGDATAKNKGEDIAEKQVREPLQKVSDLVWKPISTKLGTAKRLTISPDGTLWLLPWSSLPVGKEKYLIEEYPLHFVVSGRDLLERPGTKLGTSVPAIFSDPDFDSSTETKHASISEVYGGKLPEHPNVGRAKAKLPQVARLPNTAIEAAAVTPNLERLAKVAPQSFLNRQALESAVRGVQRPSILLLSTHGFFLPDQDAKPNDPALMGSDTRGAIISTDGTPVENPLLRCGLLFSGCNKQEIDNDDGVLNGMEIASMDLRGTNLVVLSACETGIGEVRNGEGVAGLRQAFQMAGAQSVVATLWQVPDRDSAILMDSFFSNMADGQKREDALRNAQLKRIETRREKYGAAHPYYWGAWTLTGD